MAGASFEFRIEGLDELRGDFEKVYRSYPAEAVSAVFKLAGSFTRDVNEKFPAYYESEGKGSLRNWKRTRAAGISGATAEVEVVNKARHWHLVENGHRILGYPDKYRAHVKNKEKKVNHSALRKQSKKVRQSMLVCYGWVPGKFYCERTRDEWNNGKFAEGLRKFVDKLLKEHNL